LRRVRNSATYSEYFEPSAANNIFIWSRAYPKLASAFAIVLLKISCGSKSFRTYPFGTDLIYLQT
jgi:hypothetical protein